ncbi:MAG: pitrilysin family protein, partial [Bacteroidota bacterium]
LQLKPYTLQMLDNGVKVYSVDAGIQEVLMLDMVFFSGNWFEEQNIVAASTNFLLKNGTKNKTAFEINEYFEYYGAHVNRNCYNETANITLHCLSKHLSELLPVMEEMLTDAVFPEEELSVYKQNTKQRLLVNLKKCDFVANRLIDAYLFGKGHPYGRYTSAEEYDAIQREQLLGFYDKYYRNGQCIIFIAGKLPKDYIKQLNKFFGKLSLSNRGTAINVIDTNASTGKKFKIINDAEGVQGAIRIAREFPNRHHPDFQKVQVLNSLFGGFFGSRLMSNIREDKGYTYGIYSYLQNHLHQNSWMISTEAGRDVCEATVKEVYHEMKRLKNEPVDADELMLVKNYMMGSLLGELDGPFQILGRWKNYILNNLDETYFYKSIDIIKNITAEELQSLANKYLNEEDFYELVVV